MCRKPLLTVFVALLFLAGCGVVEEVKEEPDMSASEVNKPSSEGYKDEVEGQEHLVSFETYHIDGPFDEVTRRLQESLTPEMIEQLEQLPEHIRWYIYTTHHVLHMFVNNAEGRRELVRNANLINENDVDLILGGSAKTLEELNRWREENNIQPYDPEDKYERPTENDRSHIY
ncbi:hypothetical protein GCM10010965_12470 [Caldalkalibacillus thermarum]|uniref:hypothetical protein n=1 Tax=Caldalkalibacillus thermarum TaxID=296745 RepID=UPI00166C7E89|nr:hypothetical protein [Caldalkalibacillus thermarum]GGK20877.1 hypothetical protein GCM10010965_12470 [Caldalkalibacillus thermarum]